MGDQSVAEAALDANLEAIALHDTGLCHPTWLCVHTCAITHVHRTLVRKVLETYDDSQTMSHFE